MGYGMQSAKNINGYLAPLIQGRIRQDVLSWKEALQEAEIPLPLLAYRIRMQQMYMDTVLDGHVFACIEKRKRQILLKDFEIVDTKGNVDDKATQTIRKAWFYDIINYTLDAPYFGYTLMGLGDIVNGNFKKIHLLRRPNISPDRLNIAFVPYAPSGINFRDPDYKDDSGESFYDWTLWVSTPSDYGISECGYGLLYKVSLYQILLRNNIGDNATYNELFGQPLRIGKTSKKDKVSRSAFEAQMDNMGSAAWILLDEEDQLDFKEAKSSGRGNEIYGNFEERLEKKISKILLGHADAMEGTPGKLGGQGKDEDGVGKALIEIEKHDTAFVENVMNDEILPKLIKLGIKIPKGKLFRFRNDREKEDARKRQDTNNTATAALVKTFKDAGKEVPDEYITERTGIPIKKGEPVVEKEPQESFDKVANKMDSLYHIH